MYKRLIRFLSKNTKYRYVFVKKYLYLDKNKVFFRQKHILLRFIKIGCVSWNKNSILVSGLGNGCPGF